MKRSWEQVSDKVQRICFDVQNNSILAKKLLSLVKFVLSSVTLLIVSLCWLHLLVEQDLLKWDGKLTGFAAVINLGNKNINFFSIGFVIKMFAIIQFFPAAKLFNGLPCHSFSVHHFAKETLFQTNFVKTFFKMQD